MPLENKKVFFVSDAHLGFKPREQSIKTEKLFVRWLDEMKDQAAAFYLVGDIFDYWWEYKKVVPRGFTRTLGKIAEITDMGIPVHFFTGNHDVWVFDYLPREVGVTVHKKPVVETINNKKFFIAHGDGLGPREGHYKFLKAIFDNKILQWLYARLHPNFTTMLAHQWANKSRYIKGDIIPFKGEEKEKLMLFAKDMLKKEHFDYFVFGHRHLPLNIKLNNNSSFICLGDWFHHFTYAVFDGDEMIVKSYKKTFY